MQTDITSIVGLAAATLTTLAFLPQVIKTWRTHQTRDISLIMFLAFCAGIGFWLIYGFMRDDTILIVANAITLSLASIILVLKLKYK